MRLNPITLISILAGVVPLGSVGAFFLYVSPLTIIYVAAGSLAMVLIYALRVLQRTVLAPIAEDSPRTQSCPKAATPAGPDLRPRRSAPSEFLSRPEIKLT